jgi:NADP-reducing hydrogenase subunit HndB
MTVIRSLEDLNRIRAAVVEVRQRLACPGAVRVVISLGSCGIAAGARPVMLSFVEELKRRNLVNVTVSQTGCIGMCRLEPMVDVIVPGQEKVTYVNVKPEMVGRIVAEHIVNGRPVETYTIGAAEDAR